MFANEKWSTMWTKLCWNHYREVLSLKDIDEIKYYLNEYENKNLINIVKIFSCKFKVKYVFLTQVRTILTKISLTKIDLI